MAESMRPVRASKASAGSIAHQLAIGAHVLLSDEPVPPVATTWVPSRISCSTRRWRLARP